MAIIYSSFSDAFSSISDKLKYRIFYSNVHVVA